jgi:hypothetical protein
MPARAPSSSYLPEGLKWVLVVSKRFVRRRIAAFHAPKPVNIISKRELVDDRR